MRWSWKVRIGTKWPCDCARSEIKELIGSEDAGTGVSTYVKQKGCASITEVACSLSRSARVFSSLISAVVATRMAGHSSRLWQTAVLDLFRNPSAQSSILGLSNRDILPVRWCLHRRLCEIPGLFIASERFGGVRRRLLGKKMDTIGENKGSDVLRWCGNVCHQCSLPALQSFRISSFFHVRKKDSMGKGSIYGAKSPRRSRSSP